MDVCSLVISFVMGSWLVGTNLLFKWSFVQVQSGSWEKRLLVTSDGVFVQQIGVGKRATSPWTVQVCPRVSCASQNFIMMQNLWYRKVKYRMVQPGDWIHCRASNDTLQYELCVKHASKNLTAILMFVDFWLLQSDSNYMIVFTAKNADWGFTNGLQLMFQSTSNDFESWSFGSWWATASNLIKKRTHENIEKLGTSASLLVTSALLVVTRS